MDMGDILNQWDSYQADKVKKQKESGKNQVSHKKANAPTPEEKARAAEKDFEAQMRRDNEKQINPMELWLRRYGTIDKDKIAEENELKNRETDRNYLISMAPEARIDLHGLHQDEAYEQWRMCHHHTARLILLQHIIQSIQQLRYCISVEMCFRFIKQYQRVIADIRL